MTVVVGGRELLIMATLNSSAKVASVQGIHLATLRRIHHGTSLGGRPGRWGYGMLWWVWDAPSWPGMVTGPLQDAYTAMGAFGQYITVLPQMDMVVTIKVDFEGHQGYEIDPEEYSVLLQMAFNSNCHGECN